MSPEHSLLAWTALAVALVLTPGPDTMLVVGNASRRGFRAGMAAASGIMLGGVWYMALCGFGFLSILNAVPSLFTIVKIAGALYLAWLGIQLLRGAMKPAAKVEEPAQLGAPFRQGFLSTVLNPKVAVVFLAALPQFVGTGPDAPMLGVGLIAIVYGIGFLWCLILSALATSMGRKVGQSGVMRWFEGVLGAAFLGLAGRLALARN
jgi:threonine/homoserine/homoserine lactone efflux protein